MSNPYRIGIDARFYRAETGGLGRYTRELIFALATRDHTNQYYIFITPQDESEWSVTQANFHPVTVPIGHYSLSEQTSLIKVFNSYNLDLIHFLNFNHPLLYSRPFVTTLHDLTLYFFPAGKSTVSPLRRSLFRYVFRHSLQAAQKVIAISEYTKSDAHKHLGIPLSKMVVIPEGGPEPRKLGSNTLSEVQKYLGTTEPYFLFVSQWRPHKGIITLIEAFNAFKSVTKLPHKLVLLGNQKVVSPEVLKAVTTSSHHTDIIAPGFAPDNLLPALYHHAVASVIPSEYEGFGLPVLEAFTYGAPVIVAKNSSLPEVAGQAALYFPTKNALALAKQLEQLASDQKLAEHLRQLGHAQLKHFSWTKTAEQTHAVYMDILGH